MSALRSWLLAAALCALLPGLMAAQERPVVVAS